MLTKEYKWKFGKISYSVYGDKDSAPLLLVPQSNTYSSGYEWLT